MHQNVLHIFSGPRDSARRAAFVCLGILLSAHGAARAQAQDIDPVQGADFERARVTSNGSATVYVRPTHVVFWMTRLVIDSGVQEALTRAMEVGTDVRARLEDSELHPSLLEAAVPSIISMQDGAVQSSVEVRFPMAAYVGGETGAAKFGKLCDTMKAIGKSTGCTVSGPELMTTDTPAVIQGAVAEAARNALIAAAGAAGAMNTSIRAVDLVDVGEITWNEPPDSHAAYPTIEELACTARVRVTYTVE